MTQLPRRAAAKLTQLSILADEATELCASTQRRIREVDEAIGMAAEPENLHSLTSELEALKLARANHQRRRDSLKAVVANVRHWLERVPPNTPLEPLQPTLAQPSKAESLKEAIDRVRASIDGVKVELSIVRQATLPKADLKLQASAYVAGLIEKSRPTVRATGDGLMVRFNNSLAGPPTSQDVAGLIAFMDNGASLKKQLHAQIDAMDLSNSLGRDERENKLSKLRNDLSTFELQEEALVELATEQGLLVERRADANPAAILGVKIGKVEARQRVTA